MTEEAEKRQARRLEMEKFFTDENRNADTREHLSPSGRYRLVVSTYSTKPGAWSYTRGQVFRTRDDTLIFDVVRNYSSFTHTWVEGHSNGHDYLIV